MAIRSLHIQNMRVLEDVRLTFTPGFNVLVGDNGSGKTTVLDAISATLKRWGVAREDIRNGAKHLQILCELHSGDIYQLQHERGGEVHMRAPNTSSPVVICISPQRALFDGEPSFKNQRASLGNRWISTIVHTIRDHLSILRGVPVAEASAIVLIDGLETGLHPTSQRDLLHTLIDTFPMCQFIATTHSPVIISELRREQVQILTPEGVEHPDYCYGQDASTILTSVQGALCRPVAVQDALDHLAHLARPETLQEAREALLELASKLELGENDPELVGVATALQFLEGDL